MVSMHEIVMFPQLLNKTKTNNSRGPGYQAFSDIPMENNSIYGNQLVVSDCSLETVR